MVMRLNEPSAKCLASAGSKAESMHASVATKPSMVAILGLIMPAPFEIPVSVMVWPLMLIWREAAFGRVSVVIIACAALYQLCAVKFSMAGARPANNFSMGRCSKITPVENGKICVACNPI